MATLIATKNNLGISWGGVEEEERDFPKDLMKLPVLSSVAAVEVAGVMQC